MTDYEVRREEAVKSLEERRDFRIHFTVYVIVNAILVAIWALSGAGYFWPVWPLLGWGIGVAFHALSVYTDRKITEGDIQREMARSGDH